MKKKAIIGTSVGVVATLGLGLGLGLGLTLPNRGEEDDGGDDFSNLPVFPEQDKVFQDFIDTFTLEKDDSEDGNHFYEADDDEMPSQTLSGYQDTYYDDKNRPTLIITYDFEYKQGSNDNAAFETTLTYDYFLGYGSYTPETIEVEEDGATYTFEVNEMYYYSDYLNNDAGEQLHDDERYYNEFMYIQLTKVETDEIYELGYVDDYENTDDFHLVAVDGSGYPESVSQPFIVDFGTEHMEEIIGILELEYS